MDSLPQMNEQPLNGTNTDDQSLRMLTVSLVERGIRWVCVDGWLKENETIQLATSITRKAKKRRASRCGHATVSVSGI